MPQNPRPLRTSFSRIVFIRLRDWDRFRIFLETHGSVQDWEVTLTRRDGGHIQVLLSGIARRSRAGRLSGFDVIAKNITERKRIEQEILQEKKTTEGILEGLPVPVFVIDRQHRITYWNKACEELTGYTRQEMVGTQKQWLPVYPQRTANPGRFGGGPECQGPGILLWQPQLASIFPFSRSL